MRRLVLFLAIVLVLFTGAAVFDWWVDPFGQVWKPDVLSAARAKNCLVSQELIGDRYWAFKHDVFSHRPTRSFVVGSSRVLKMAAAPGETSFANLGYPGTSPKTILALLRSLTAKPAQTVYIGVEPFWFNANGYNLDVGDLSPWKELEYLLARKTFTRAITLSRESAQLPLHRWRVDELGGKCVLDRFVPAISWRTDGSRVWGFELDPKRFPRFTASPFRGDLATWRNGYYANWQRLDPKRIQTLVDALDLARGRGWNVVGFTPPEPPHMLHVLETDPRLAPQWRMFTETMPKLFRQRGFRWVDTSNGAQLGCKPSDFPDAFHSDARCSALLRYALRSGAG